MRRDSWKIAISHSRRVDWGKKKVLKFSLIPQNVCFSTRQLFSPAPTATVRPLIQTLEKNMLFVDDVKKKTYRALGRELSQENTMTHSVNFMRFLSTNDDDDFSVRIVEMCIT